MTANGCQNIQNVTVNVNPSPSVDPLSNQVYCPGNTVPVTNLTGPVSGTTFTWTNNNTAIGLGASSSLPGLTMPSFTAGNSGTAPITGIITVTPHTPAPNTCTGTPVSYTITVNPAAQVTDPADQVVCNGSATTEVAFTTNRTGGTTTYSWVNDTPAIGLTGSGNGNIASFNAVNTGTAPVVATITVTPHFTNLGITCDGTPQVFTITVNPDARMNVPDDQEICSGNQINTVNFTTMNTGGTTSYSWTNDQPSIGLAANGTGNIGVFTAVNSTTIPVTATIRVTPSFTNGSATCVGLPQDFNITVNPAPAVNAITNQSYCSGGAVPSTVITGPVSGTTFTWTNSNTSIGLGANGTGDVPAFTATNALNVPVTATISITPSANGCTGTPSTYTITVNPTATVNTPPDQSHCAGATVPITAIAGPVSGTTFTWTNSNTVIGLAASGSGNSIPSFTATNSTSSTITSTVTIIPSANGCNGTPSSYNISIHPTASVNPIGNQAHCNGDAVPATPITSPVSGTTFNWTNSNPGIGLAASGSGNSIPSFTAINATSASITAIITITPTANSCQGTQTSYTITVNPTATVNTIADQSYCPGNLVPATTITGPVSGTTFTWTNSNTAIGLAASGSGNSIPSFTAANSTSSAITSTVTITPTANGCEGTHLSYIISIHPGASVNPISDQVHCNGDAVPATPITGPVSGTTFTWANSNPGIGLAASGTGNIPAFTATNNGTVPVSATITITTSATGCTGTPYSFTITVNPTPQLSSPLNLGGICSGESVLYTPSSLVSGTTFSWSRLGTPGIEPLTSSGVGDINEILDNTTVNPLTVTYNYTLTANGCSSSNQNVTVTVTQSPVLTTTIPSSPTVCSGQPFTFNATSPTAGASFSWTRPVYPGISNPAGSGTGDIIETLVNTTTGNIPVTYYYTLSSNGCTNPVLETVTVVVVPAPVVTASASTGTNPICAGLPFNLFSSSNLGSLLPDILLQEGFESAAVGATTGPNGWTTAQNPNPNNASWTVRADGYNTNGATHSNTSDRFYVSNNYTSGGTTTNSLISPVFSTVGYTTLSLDFYHYYRDNSRDNAFVDISVNGGGTWTTFQTYNSTQGSSNNFQHGVLNLSAYIGNSNLRIRFRYLATSDYYWAIDNIRVSGTSPAPAMSWTSIPAGFTSTDPNPTGVTQNVTTTYIATYVDGNTGCPGSASVTVTNVLDTEPPVMSGLPGDVTIPCQECITAFINADFEENPTFTNPPGYYYVRSVPGDQGVPGWFCDTPQETIEVMVSGFDGLVSQSGNYHAELNSQNDDNLPNPQYNFYQEFCTVPTTTVRVTFYHRKRSSQWITPNGNPDVMEVMTGPNLANLSSAGIFSTTNTQGWDQRVVDVHIPEGQTTTVFLFRSVSNSTNSTNYGNLIDNIHAVTIFDATGIPANATDNCYPYTITPSVTETRIDGNCPGNYRLIRTWTATDLSGNTSTHTQTITVGDVDSPEFDPVSFPDDVTISCSDPVPALPDLSSIIATDNCDPDVTVTYLGEERTDGSCPESYTLRRSWRAIDDCDNEATATQVITIVDNLPPTWTTTAGSLDRALFCTDAEGLTAALALAPTATDICSSTVTVTLTSDVTTPDACAGTYTRVRTWTAADDCDNTSAPFTQTITVTDNVAPVWDQAAGALDAALTCSDAAGLTAALALAPTATDACGSAVTITPVNDVTTPGACAGTYTRVRTWTAADACNNTSAAFTQTITVTDNVAPVSDQAAGALDANLTCADAAGLTAALAQAPSATDACESGVNITQTSDVTTPGACAGTYTRVRTWTAADACNNTSAAFTQTITVTDNSSPTWITAEGGLDRTIECSDAAGLTAAQALAPVASDNCDLTLTPAKTAGLFVAGACAQAGTYTNTWTVTDDCGNTSGVFTQVITLEDNTNPVITCPPNVSIDCDDSSDPAQTGTATATDNCDPSPSITYSDNTVAGLCPQASTIERTWLATDDCGNFTTCLQTITIQDISAPVLVGVPEDIPVDCNSIPAVPVVTATDNCDPSLTVIYEETSNTVIDGCGIIVRTWSVTDDCGNHATDSQTITVTDNTNPVLVGVPDDISVDCNSIPAAPVVTATDNCDPSLTVIYEETSNTVIDGCGIIVRTWSVTDNCGNTASDSQTITVTDNTAPSWTTSAGALNTSVSCSDPIGLGIAQDMVPIVSDICDPNPSIVKTTGDFIPGVACPHVGTYTNTWTAIDNCGNTSTIFTQVISVTDNDAPVWDQPAGAFNANLLCSDATGLADALSQTPSATDACGTVSVALFSDETTPGACTGTYTRIRTWTATDNCGNMSGILFTQTINVTDDVAPVWNEAEEELDAAFSCDDTAGLIAALALAPTATDACGSGVNITPASDVTTPGACAGTYTRERTWSVTDDCGNTGTIYIQVITVTDIDEPVFYNIPDDVTIDCEEVVPGNPDDILAIDNCSDDVSASIVYDPGTFIPSASCPWGGTITHTWTVNDGCGNIATAQQVITIIDVTPPTWTTASGALDITLECSDAAGLADAQAQAPVPTDNCDVTLTPEKTIGAFVAGDCPEEGTYTNTWIVTDDCGNASAVYTQVITIVDMQAPTVTPASNGTSECTGTDPSLNADYIAWLANHAGATATDACGSTIT